MGLEADEPELRKPLQRHGFVGRRTAKPCTPVQFRAWPPPAAGGPGRRRCPGRAESAEHLPQDL